jgi:hypothetical protein
MLENTASSHCVGILLLDRIAHDQDEGQFGSLKRALNSSLNSLSTVNCQNHSRRFCAALVMYLKKLHIYCIYSFIYVT